METVDPTQLGNAMIVWLGFVAALFAATQSPMEKFVKPFVLHPLRGKFAPVNTYYSTVCQVVVLVVSAAVAWPLRYQLDLLANVFEYVEWHPFVGALPAVFLAAFAGQHIHDRFGTVKDDDNA